MLELRPSCEQCNKSLPPNSGEAMICSFECTFCRDCVEKLLLNVCPNCGGGFTNRPVRPQHDLRNQNFLGRFPATRTITHQPVDIPDHQAFALEIKDVPPEHR